MPYPPGPRPDTPANAAQTDAASGRAADAASLRPLKPVGDRMSKGREQHGADRDDVGHSRAHDAPDLNADDRKRSERDQVHDLATE